MPDRESRGENDFGLPKAFGIIEEWVTRWGAGEIVVYHLIRPEGGIFIFAG